MKLSTKAFKAILDYLIKHSDFVYQDEKNADIIYFVKEADIQLPKQGKLVGVCNCLCHCGLPEERCITNHDKQCEHCWN